MNPAPHLVDKLPDVPLPQVVHHVLGREVAVRHSPAPHTTHSKKPVFPLQPAIPAKLGLGPQAGWGQKGTGSLRSDTSEQETCPQLPLP